jgi:hypothetical protein
LVEDRSVMSGFVSRTEGLDISHLDMQRCLNLPGEWSSILSI